MGDNSFVYSSLKNNEVRIREMISECLYTEDVSENDRIIIISSKSLEVYD